MSRDPADRKHFVQMIDVLYAVVLGRGMFDMAKELKVPRDYQNFLTPPFFLFVFTIGIVARDWINYHELIRKHPHRRLYRFIIDILILFVFFFLLRAAVPGTALTPEDIKVYATLWTSYCLLLVLWELGANWESSADTPDDVKGDLWWNVAFLAVTGVWALLAYLERWNAATEAGALVAAVLTIAIAIVKRFKTTRF